MQTILKHTEELRILHKYQEALDFINSALLEKPDSLELLFEKAIICETGLQDYNQALRIYSAILNKDPNQIRAWSGKAIIQYLLCNDEAALFSFSQVIRLIPDFSAAAWRISGLLSKDSKISRKYLETALKLNPHYINAKSELTELLTQEGQYDQALTLIKATLDHPTAMRADDILAGRLNNLYLQAAHLSNLNKDCRTALHYLNHISPESINPLTDPESAVFYYEMAVALRGTGKPEEAYTYIKEFLKYQNSADAWKQKAYSELECGRSHDALESLQKGIALGSNDEYSTHKLAEIYYKLNRIDESLLLWNSILTKDPENTVGLMHKADILSRKSEYEESLSIYEKLIAANPDDSQLLFSFGVALDRMNHTEKSIEVYERCLKINEHFGGAWNNLGYASYKNGNYEKAVLSYSQSIRCKDDFAGAWYNRACSQALLGNEHMALSDLKQAVNLRARYRKAAAGDDDFISIKDSEEFIKITQS